MATEKVLCCFKNLKVDPNGPKILARNLNKVLNTTTFDIVETQGANNDKCELECTKEEADYIRLHLADLVTSDHRSIWFTYQTKPSDYPLENNKINFSKNQTPKSWTTLYNFGSMISYDRFIGHILDNRCPAWTKVYKDTRGRPKSIVLERQYTKYRMIFDLNIFHTDILVNYGQENNNGPVQIVFMLKGLPHIEQRIDNGDHIRICNSSQHGVGIDAISQCSDLWLQFEHRTDAYDFLQQLLISNYSNQFILNYANFQLFLSSNIKYLCSSWDCSNFPSELGLYGMNMLWSLGYTFTDKYRTNNDIQSKFISCHQKLSAEKFYELCCTLWNRLQENHCYFIPNVFDDQNKINCTLRKNTYRVPHAIVTPLRILFQPMHVTKGHRAMRQYDDKKSYKWMLVYIRDEDKLSKISNLNGSNELRDRYKNILQNGLDLLSLTSKQLIYCYFGSSGSQMKKQEFWFMAPVGFNSVDAVFKVNEARIALGNLKKIQNIATYIARVGLYLTTSKPTDIKLTYVGKFDSFFSKISSWFPLSNPLQKWIKPREDYTKCKAYLIEDIERSGYCFTDGVGLISLGLAKKVAILIGIRIIKDEDIPSAYQVRVAGCKGMLSLDPNSTMDDYYIKVRKSMMKFDSDDWTLDIVDHSRLMCLSLNNQIIRLLYDLNNENKAVLESLQNRCILQGQWHPPEEGYLNIFDSQDVDRIKDEYRRQGYINAKDLLRRNKIPLPVDEARCLFGIADETKSLKPGQCFIQYQTMDKKSYKIVKGEVLVTKNPCLYPGDIRRLEAVDIPELRPFIRDCIVFPVLGSRPHSNEISGSDLDGDQYWVYWGKELTVKEMIPPLDYTPALKKPVPEVTPELIVNHILDTLDDQTSGIISNTHSVIADKDPNGTRAADCKYLAELFPRAIDSVKTGEKINMDRVNTLRQEKCQTYPTWMIKDDKQFYKSESINGYLFNKVQNLKIHSSVYKFMYMKYEKINKDVSINIEADDDINKQYNFLYKILLGFYQLLNSYLSFSSFINFFKRQHWLTKLIIICLFIYFIFKLNFLFL